MWFLINLLYMRGIKKVRAISEYFHCVTGNTAEAWLCCSSRSDSDMLWVWFSCPFVPSECCVKMVATLKSLHQGWATLMPNLAVISAVVILQFPRINAWAHSMFVDVDGHLYLSALTTLVRLLLNILIHSYTLHCGKQFCPSLAHNCLWISAPFIPSDTRRCTVACCLSLVQTTSAAVIFMPFSFGTNGLQLNHTHSMSPSDLLLQHGQASTVLPVIQQKYSSVALTLLISFIIII
jgi:hypothetical protein